MIYLNIKLCSFRFSKNITTYEKLLESINDIDTEQINYELCIANLNKIYSLSEYLCYYGKFQFDIIDLRISEIFSNIEKEIDYGKINPKNFSEIINYIYNNIFIKDISSIKFI